MMYKEQLADEAEVTIPACNYGTDVGSQCRGKRYLLVIKNLTFLYSHFWLLAQRIQRCGWDVWIAAGETKDPGRITAAGMHYYPIPPANGAWDARGEFRTALHIHRCLRIVHPDLVHFVYLKNVITGGVLARVNRTPAVLGSITGLGTLFSEQRLAYRCIQSAVFAGLRIGFRHSNSVVAVENTDDRELFLRAGALTSGQTMIVPGSGVAWRATKQPEEPPHSPVILLTSRMIKPKGVLLLIEACNKLIEAGIDFECWLAGDLDPGNPNSLTAAELGAAEASGHIRWLGYRSDVPDLLEKCSIYCLPTYYREGLPQSLIEAAAAGKPIVTTDMPGCRDIVKNNVNGWLVPRQNSSELFSALKKLLLKPEERKRMGEASRRIFEERLTLDAVFSAFNQCYARLAVDLTL